MGRVSGKVAIITGGAQGLGRADAILLAQEGAQVAITDIKTEGGEAVAKEINEAGGEAITNYGDVSSWDDTEACVQAAIDEFGALDIVVNNAGILRDASIVRMTEDDWDLVVGVHMKGTFNMTHHACAYWQAESKEGRKRNGAGVNTVSSAGLQGNKGQANYGAAKGGIAALTMITALEGKRYGVRANAVAPGGATRIVTETFPQMDTVEANEAGEEFNRLNPGNSAPAVAWLASDEALHVTGQVFRAVGDEIAHYLPWKLGPAVKAGTEPERWDATEIGAAVNAQIFGSEIGGLQIGV